jgi:hypothetical protein
VDYLDGLSSPSSRDASSKATPVYHPRGQSKAREAGSTTGSLPLARSPRQEAVTEPGGAAANERARRRGSKRLSPAAQRASPAARWQENQRRLLSSQPSQLMEYLSPKHKRHTGSLSPRGAARESGAARGVHAKRYRTCTARARTSVLTTE